MEPNNVGEQPRPQHWRRRRDLRETSFALNIAAAVSYGFLLDALRSAGSPESDAGYYFLRGVTRIEDLMRVGSLNAVTTDVVARSSMSHWPRVGAELVVLITVAAVTTTLLALLKLAARTASYGRIIERVALPAALFASPISYLLASKVTWQTESILNTEPNPDYSWWQSPLLAILIAEVLCVGLLHLVPRRHSLSRALVGVLLFVHYAFWTAVLWYAIPSWSYRLFAWYVLLLAFPFSGAIWLLDFWRPYAPSSGPLTSTGPGKWTLSAAATSIAALVLIWWPARGASLAQIKDPASVTVELSRGPCFGSCPAYTVVIHGNGLVEYTGRRFVKSHGQQTAVIDSGRVSQIFQQLDRARFFALEDRAFAWCYDTPSVSIAVAQNGKTKRVTADSSCFGAKNGVQARFLEAADQVDQIVGSSTWVKCEGHCRN